MKKVVYFLLALSVIAFGCTDDFGRQDSKPPRYLSISPDDDIFVTHEGVPYGLRRKIMVNTDVARWDWDTETSELWCTTYENHNDNYFEITVWANDKSEEREAVITVTAKNAPPVYIKLHQGVTPELSLSPSADQDIPYGGGTLFIRVTSITSWTVESDKPWAIIYPESGEGSAPVRISIDPNPGYSPDAATITFRAGGTVRQLKIKRGGDPEGIYFTIFQGGYRVVPLDGGDIPITVTSNAFWTVSSDQAWARVETTAGTGSGSSRITVLAGTTPDVIPANVIFRAGPLTREVNIYRRVFVPDPDPDPDPGHKYKYVLEGYSTKVVYNISGNEIREGYSTRVVYTVSGNKVLEGRSTRVVYTISGSKILEGNSTRVVYMISGNRILEGYSTRVVYTLK